LSVVLGIAAIYFGWMGTVKWRFERGRAKWAAAALPRLAGLSSTSEVVRTEIAQLKAPTPNLDYGWAHDEVILMTNGEYIVYAWRHGFNSGFVDHLFLGHGSDGKWYYSTYHFCNHMAGILGDDPAGSIAEFTARYWVREFDGKPEHCLKRTWHYERKPNNNAVEPTRALSGASGSP
jgi:hypothetical protein